MRRILFVHNNFPAQFGRLGQYLAQQNWDVAFATQRKEVSLPGITPVLYEKAEKPADGSKSTTHPFANAFDAAARTGQLAAKQALALRKKNYIPDVIVAHSGWGPGLYLKNVWPEAKYVGYFEWYYQPIGVDTAFLGLTPGLDQQVISQARNAPILMDLAQSDLALCPTRWQQQQFPEYCQKQLTIHHDGIDTDYFLPLPGARHEIDGHIYRRGEKIITYVARGMEPYRGFPEFMGALAEIQTRDRDVRAIIVGQDRVAYGKKLKDGDGHKKRALEALDLDLSRIHFTGTLPYREYQKVLQVSCAHVYLTIPFVLSWSLMEAMSCACPIIASDTAPVHEMLEPDRTALFVDMKSQPEIVEAVCKLLDDQGLQSTLGENARKAITDTYSASEIFAQKEALFNGLISPDS